MTFNKWAFEYVVMCAIVAHHLKNRKRFSWIIRTALYNWSEFHFKKLMRRLKKEGITPEKNGGSI